MNVFCFKVWTTREMGEGEPNPEWDEIAENTGLDHEQVPFQTF